MAGELPDGVASPGNMQEDGAPENADGSTVADELLSGYNKDNVDDLKEAYNRLLAALNESHQRQSMLKSKLDVEEEEALNIAPEENEDNELHGIQSELQGKLDEIAIAEDRNSTLKNAIAELKTRKSALHDELLVLDTACSAASDPEIEPVKNAIAEAENELEQRKLEVERLSDELSKQQELSTTVLAIHENANAERTTLRQKLQVAAGQPARMAKQAEHQFGHPLRSYRTQLADARSTLEQLESDFAATREKLLLKEAQDSELALDVEKCTHAMNQQERQDAKMRMELQHAKDMEADILAHKAALKAKMKLTKTQLRGVQESCNRVDREKEAGLLRLKQIELRTSNAASQTEVLMQAHTEMSVQLKHKKREAESLRGSIEQASRAREKFTTKLLMSTTLMESEISAVRQMNNIIAQREDGLTEAKHIVVDLERKRKNLERMVDQGNSEMVRMEAKAMQAEQEVHEALGNVAEAAKVHDQLNKTREELEGVYQLLKNEKNKYASMTIGVRQRLTDMKDKTRILGNENEILRAAAMERTVRLHLQDQKYQVAQRGKARILSEESELKNEGQRLRELKRSINADNKQQLDEIDAQESALSELQAKQAKAVQERNDLGVRLLDRHEELVLFYEKYNHYDKVLRNGDVAIVERDDDIRLLKLERSDCQRSINVLQKAAALQHDQEDELIRLRSELLELQQKIRRLETLMVSTANIDASSGGRGQDDARRGAAGTDARGRQWKQVAVSKDLSDTDMEDRTRTLAHRMAKQETRAAEISLVLDETIRLVERVRAEVHTGKEEKSRVNKLVADSKTKIKETTRKMMALVSEVSMYQGKCIKQQQEVHEKRLDIEQGLERLNRGEAPSEQVSKEWEQQERRLLQHQQQSQALRDLGIAGSSSAEGGHAEPIAVGARGAHTTTGFRELADGTRTLAELRPNAYVGDGGDDVAAVPFGRTAPFRAQQPSSNMRHYSLPQAVGNASSPRGRAA
eukprot:m.755373 g.755373  ORF g.755373 m.755373 type:complete len:982 (-) comp23180_c0_seq1:276-3221(-)